GSLTTTHANDIVVLSIDTYTSGSSITVSSVSDSQAKVVWQGSARSSSISCSGTQETTHVEWYGIAATTVAADTITITLSSAPTSASGIVFGVSGADTTTPFDPGSTPPKTAVGCLGLDGPCQGFGSSTTATVTTASITCAANDVIIVVITAGSANSVSSMTDSLGTHLTYTARCSNCDNHGSESIEEYYAITSSSATFTVSATMSGAASYDIYAFGIKGANTATPFDISFVANTLFTGHAGNGGSGGAPTVTGVTSTNANDMIFAMEGHPSGTLETASAPFALIGSANTANGQSIAAENEMVGAVQTAITVTFGTSIPTTAWSMLVDAVQAGTSAPTVTGVSTIADNDFIFSVFGAYLSVTETAGAIAGTTSTLVTTVAGVGDSNAVEYRAITTSQSSFSCVFGTSTMFWGVLCDALMPARQSVTISYATTNSAGTVQSTMIGGSAATITALYAPISLSSSAGNVPASGYIRVVITAPAGTGLTVYWGSGKLTQFQVSYTYMSQ
ncbi:MAG: hypothetical protein OK436_01335, partial [Thaumarchaeota archaeon]|nr:hypothetical protein [Nitrososphaerota archaeon]